MSMYLMGFATGLAVCLLIGIAQAKIDHAAWMKICNRYEAVIKRLRQRRHDDPADWWKQN